MLNTTMIQFSKLVFCLSPLTIAVELPKDEYAHIPYESLYELEEKPNKNTMKYNTWTTEELVKEQNIKILERINEFEIQQELHK